MSKFNFIAKFLISKIASIFKFASQDRHLEWELKKKLEDFFQDQWQWNSVAQAQRPHFIWFDVPFPKKLGMDKPNMNKPWIW